MTCLNCDITMTKSEEDEEPDVISAHKEAETAIIFASGVEPSVLAGKKASAYIHFANKGSSNFIITSIDGSFRYPQDFSYVIQNFTVISPNKMIDAGYEGSFQYEFQPGELSGGRSFGLVINVNYKDTEENLYRDAVFNQTVQVIEDEEGLDTETFFMYLMLLGMSGLILLGVFHNVSGKSRRGKKRNTPSANATTLNKVQLETGTTNGPVDYNWIPEETLKAINKGTPSPRRSPKKRANKQRSSETE
ncbi:unnamed protein product [Clavelina lepadiformis]|uniref:Translocon-associated protein subunit alpha n=1 Tax=Clavelina lepadiformis TaxID=159417 RepID=A0ABP0G3N8_CLALP